MGNYGIVSNNENKVYEWLQEGYSAYKIAKMLGCAKSSVLKYMSKKGWTSQHKCKVNYNSLLKDKKDLVVQLHKRNMSQSEISKIVGHSAPQISTMLKKEGLYRNYKYQVDESFFSEIDTQEKAYVLGWMYSDGNVTPEGKFRIQIQKDDEEILYKIRAILQYDGPMYDIDIPKNDWSKKPQTCLCVNRKSMTEDLVRHGCSPNKSLVIEYPTWIDPTLESHFLRGILDGDGSINIKKGKYLNTSITTTDLFNKELQSRLSKMGIDSQLYYRYEHTNTCSLMVTKTSHANKFLEYLYQDSSICLARKHQKYQEFLNTK